MNEEAFAQLCEMRHAVREFDPTPIPKKLLEKLLHITQTTPSAYNLQPVSFHIVTHQQLKEALLPACMNQKSVLSAGALIVFTVDKEAFKHNFERLFDEDIRRGIITDEKVSLYRKMVDLEFSKKPFGMGWVAKALLVPLLRFFIPIPRLPAVHKKAWTSLHGGLSAMTFMLAAKSHGLATCPMSGFDPAAVKRVLKIPKNFDVPIIVAVGYSSHAPVAHAKIPLNEIITWNKEGT